MSGLTRIRVLTTTRLSGLVERYHTWPTHQRQSVGEHTWQVMRIYWEIFGAMPPEVSTYILWHDAPGEMTTGDLPFPSKARSPELKAIMDLAEDEATDRALGHGTAGMIHRQVTGAQRTRVKVCDLLDMYEFGCVERRMGNIYAQPIIDDTEAAITQLIDDASMTTGEILLVRQRMEAARA